RYSFEAIPDTFITSICDDNSDHVWIGMKSHGVAEDVNNNWIVHEGRGTIINNDVRAIAASPLGEIWIGFGKKPASGTGLTSYNNGTWQNVYALPPSCQTNAIFIDQNNVKWVGTDQGFVHFTTSADAVTFNYDNTGLNINDVTGVAQDARGNIWISTYGGGLIEYKGNH
ncbi:MAG TPA: two-component regulator propeller domain-containing protein, partial [Ignavibacteriaceae bacterium]|nr:two-component regulator propeller domain-containing protein [Ignavibacteriaceae bacterium]